MIYGVAMHVNFDCCYMFCYFWGTPALWIPLWDNRRLPGDYCGFPYWDNRDAPALWIPLLG